MEVLTRTGRLTREAYLRTAERLRAAGATEREIRTTLGTLPPLSPEETASAAPTGPSPEEQIALVDDLLRQGLSAQKIGERVGWPTEAVRRHQARQRAAAAAGAPPVDTTAATPPTPAPSDTDPPFHRRLGPPPRPRRGAAADPLASFLAQLRRLLDWIAPPVDDAGTTPAPAPAPVRSTGPSLRLWLIAGATIALGVLLILVGLGLARAGLVVDRTTLPQPPAASNASVLCTVGATQKQEPNEAACEAWTLQQDRALVAAGTPQTVILHPAAAPGTSGTGPAGWLGGLAAGARAEGRAALKAIVDWAYNHVPGAAYYRQQIWQATGVR